MMTTNSIASFDSPNQMMAAGTQATDGRICSPVMSGPNPRRKNANFVNANPMIVPMTTEIAKPTNAR